MPVEAAPLQVGAEVMIVPGPRLRRRIRRSAAIVRFGSWRRVFGAVERGEAPKVCPDRGQLPKLASKPCSGASSLVIGLTQRFNTRAKVCRGMPFRPCCSRVGPLPDPNLCCSCIGRKGPASRRACTPGPGALKSARAPARDPKTGCRQLPAGPRWVKPNNLFCGALVSVVPCLLGESQVRFV
jgi:hypothetical protein